jgi:glycosyltransferase involved in cell wall biosynthesis
MKKDISIVVPVYLEFETIGMVLKRLLGVEGVSQIVVVDDGSNDGSWDVIQKYAVADKRVQAVQHSRNLGKSKALKTGFALTTGSVVVVQDADLEYDPSELPDLVRPILDGMADVVYGSRFLVRRASRVLYFYHYLGNKLITFISNLFTNINFTDVETGYKAFRGDIIRNMIIESKGFGFEIEVSAKIAKLKCRVYEVPISYYGRTYEEGKKIGFIDGLHALACIFKYNLLRPLKTSYTQVPYVHRGTRLHT